MRHSFGKPLKITVPGRAAKSSGDASYQAGDQNKGIGEPFRQDEFLPRRLSKTGIQFNDVGQIIVGGVWRNLPFSIAPPVENLPSEPLVRDLEINDYAARDAELVDGESGRLINSGRRIEKAHGDYFNIKITGDGFTHYTRATDPAWTSGGLKLTAEELAADNFTIQNVFVLNGNEFESPDYGYFPRIVLTGASKNKITDVYDAGAPSVPFAPAAADNYYLLPLLAAPDGRVNRTQFERVRVGFSYTPLPRFPDKPALKVTYNTVPEPDTDNARFVAAANVLVDLPNIKGFADTDDGAGWTSYGAGGFPGETHFSRRINYVGAAILTGVLAAVIRQNNNWYYVWT